MSKTKVTKIEIHSNEPKAARRKGLQSFSALVPEDEKFKFTDHPGEVFYIVKIEKKFSDLYGDGYVVHVKDFPEAKQTMTAGVFGAIPGKQMDKLYEMTNGGIRISLDSPVPVKIEEVPTKKGMSYRFTDPFAK